MSATASACGPHWVGTWAASPSGAQVAPTLSVADQTYRIMVTPHRGGASLRVTLTNRGRPLPVEFGHVTIAKQATQASIAPQTLQLVTFGGRRSVVAPIDGDVTSDPISLSFDAFEPLAISVHTPGIAIAPVEHNDGFETSYYSPPFTGDATTDVAGSGAWLPTTTVPWVTGLDVRAPAGVTGAVAFGDSITNGRAIGDAAGTTPAAGSVDHNVRYPDFLQRRLTHSGDPVVVLNAGITGNKLLYGGPYTGASGLGRSRRDVVEKAGVTDVIVLEGINDLLFTPAADYHALVAAYTTLIDRFHRAGLTVHLGTILPAAGEIPLLNGPAVHEVRDRVNEWIRGQRLADYVIDFDAALRDPHDADRLASRYAGPDLVHPNALGYEAMANAIDLATLHRPAPCNAGEGM